jgi:hypothetical protein
MILKWDGDPLRSEPQDPRDPDAQREITIIQLLDGTAKIITFFMAISFFDARV